jgi:CO/xanthine dehydrogenase Mo-binding subunit
MADHISGLGRRGFLVSALAGGAVGFGWGTLPGTGRSGSAAAAARASFSPTIWYEIDPAGIVTVNITKSEMGQHVGTALAQMVCEELEAGWTNMRIRHVDSDPKWGLMITGGSWSVNWTFDSLSRAGAAGRTSMIAAAAKQWGVDATTCHAADGKVVCGGNSIGYGELISAGAVTGAWSDDDLKKLTLKAPGSYKVIGQSVQALDIPLKVNGTAKYGIDFKAPGMVYGKIVLPPARNGSVAKSVDDSGAKGVPGFVQALSLKDPSGSFTGLVLSIGETYWAAMKGAALIKVDWDAGPTAHVDDAALIAEARRLQANPDEGSSWVKDGDAGGVLAKSAGVISAEYTTGINLHAPMEPTNATAVFADGIWHFHGGNQFQSFSLPLVARAMEVDPSKVVLHQYWLGGGFGRRLMGDYFIPAGLAAKALGKPVKVVYSRTDDMRLDCARSPSWQKLSGAVADGKVAALTQDVACGWPTNNVAPALIGKAVDGRPVDPFAINGADVWYSFPNHHVRLIDNKLAEATVPPGYLRSVAPGFTVWALESFIDELAHSAGADPVAFRLAHLDGAGKNAGTAPMSVGGATRLAAVLKQAVARSGYGTRTLPEGTAFGVAIGQGQERADPTFTACVAEVAVNKKTGKFTIHKLTVVYDVGTAVNPDGVTSQMESATLWGLSLALYETTTIRDGAIAAANFDGYTPTRMSQVPPLDVSFISEGHFPSGTGEPATTVVGPAIGNAIAAASGARVRALPITAAKVKAALA